MDNRSDMTPWKRERRAHEATVVGDQNSPCRGEPVGWNTSNMLRHADVKVGPVEQNGIREIVVREVRETF